MEARYMLGESRGKIDHLLFMIDLKLYDKTMQGGDSLVQTVSIFSNDIDVVSNFQVCNVRNEKR